MNRRLFLKRSSLASIGSLLFNGMPIAFNNKSLLKFLSPDDFNQDRVLILINLSGGNDGLNTVIPIDQYSNLSRARSNILIPENRILSLNGYTNTGLHPAMSRMQQLFNEGKLNIIQNVGYSNPNFSHFRATDIWNTASDSNEYIHTGWIGRWLQDAYSGYPEGYPNSTMPDPIAITIGAINSPTCEGNTTNHSISIANPNDIYNLLNSIQESAPANTYGDELTYVRTVMQQANIYLQEVKNAASASINLSNLYPNNNTLADQLKIVARLISGGLQTKVYAVNLGGFDTHSLQVDTSNTSIGEHALLLQKLSEAIYAFMDDIRLMGIENKVLGLTYSEFGRRIASNGSLGTDHGAAAPVFLFGDCVKQSIIGTNVQIPQNVNIGDNIPMQYDFRQIYATVLKDWFQIPEVNVQQYLYQQNFATLDILECNANVGIDKHWENEEVLLYPNPCTQFLNVELNIQKQGTYTMFIYDSLGKLYQTKVHNNLKIGKQKIYLNTESFANGNYFICIAFENKRKTLSFIKMK